MKTDAIMKLKKEKTRQGFTCVGEILVWGRDYRAKISNGIVLFTRWRHFIDNTE